MMRITSDVLFDMPVKEDKNSTEFDKELLKEMIGLSVQTKDFDKTIRKIMRKKSSCTLWFSNKETRIWDGKEYHDVNYRCCPSSHKANYYFCLQLKRTENIITVLNGYLEAV